MVSYEADAVLNKNVNKYILSPHQNIVLLFCNKGSLEGAIDTIIGTKTDLVFQNMKLILSSGIELRQSTRQHTRPWTALCKKKIDAR